MTHRRYEPIDFKWLIIEPLLPNKPRGVARVDDRKVPNGIYRRGIAPGRHSRPLMAPPATIGSSGGAGSVSGTVYSTRCRQFMTDRSNLWVPP